MTVERPAASGTQRFSARAALLGDRAGSVVLDAVVDVVDGSISWVGPASDAPPAPGAAVVSLPGLLLPGLVNTHAHGPMVLLRGQGEGLPLDRWLREVMWPREAHLTPDDVEVAMTAASVEMLRHGVTTSVEMYFHPERLAAGVRAAGARAVVASPLIDLPGLGSLDDQLAGAVAHASSGDPQVEFAVGPHAAYTVPLPVLRRAAAAARDHGLLLTLHVAETATEGDGLLASTGRTTPVLLAEHDVLGGRVLGAHCVHFTDEDLGVWHEHGAAVAHCPGSNAKLASGVARLRDMLDRGIPVGVGTDGPASRGDLDLLGDVRLAAQLARLREGDPLALSAPEALWLATGGAAAAIGRPDLGRLEAGCRADLVHVDLDDTALSPLLEPEDLVTHLVWSSGGRHVRDTWVAGRQVVREGRSTAVDEGDLRVEVQRRARRLAG